MSRWFTTYEGYNWTPNDGYSELFKDYVIAIREWFHLEKTNIVGVEVAKGTWKKYRVQGKEISVILDRFEWKHYSNSEEVFFKMKLRVGSRGFGNFLLRLFNRQTPMNVIFNEEITVLFPGNFPSNPPYFQINNRGYHHLSDLHRHHIFSGGIMCIMADSSDWNPNRDTILRAVNAAIDWIVWHYDTWGNNPERWSHD